LNTFLSLYVWRLNDNIEFNWQVSNLKHELSGSSISLKGTLFAAFSSISMFIKYSQLFYKVPNGSHNATGKEILDKSL
jgi:hypothetical protein